MNCQAAQLLLSAERDQPLGAGVRAPLEAHLAECAACRKLRATLAESAAAWRVTTANVPVPDERLEWQRIRRRLHGEGQPEVKPTFGWLAWWRGLSFAAVAAAVAFGVFLAPSWNGRGAGAAVAATDTVEVGGDASSAMVFVDDKSGWLVVWAAGATSDE
jgi:anti-sigma factor RsiW